MTATVPQDSRVHDKLYIGGEWVAPADPRAAISVINPATEEVIGQIPEGAAGDINRAVAAARAAFPGWSEISVEQRAGWIERIGVTMSERLEQIAALISEEVGMPIRQAVGIQAGLPTMTFNALPAVMAAVPWEEEVGNSLILREPVGVVAGITPWNYPLHQICAKVAPALAAGCTFVLKPSEVTPLNAFMLASILDEVGLPAGVFNRSAAMARSSGRRWRASGRRHGVVHRFHPDRAAGGRAGGTDGQAGGPRARRQVA